MKATWEKASTPAYRRVRSSLRWRCLVAMAGAWAAFSSAPAQAQLSNAHARVSADLTWDDNVTRSGRDEELSDGFARLNLGVGMPVELTPHSRLLLDIGVGGYLYDRYSGLNRTVAEFQGELQYRSSGQYTTPIYGLYLRQAVDWYNSDLRDGYRTSIGVSVRKPVTDRIALFGAVGYNWRNADSDVFDTREVSVRGNVDYALARRHTLYLGLEYRDGDVQTTSIPEPALASIKITSVPDDVFTSPQRNSYRFKARTGVLTLGYNFALFDNQGLDLSYRTVYSRPKDQPPDSISTQSIFYVDHQVTLSYLIRF